MGHLSVCLSQSIVIASGAGELHKAITFGPSRILVHDHLHPNQVLSGSPSHVYSSLAVAEHKLCISARGNKYACLLQMLAETCRDKACIRTSRGFIRLLRIKVTRECMQHPNLGLGHCAEGSEESSERLIGGFLGKVSGEDCGRVVFPGT